MSVRTLLLVLSTTTLSVLVGCATTQTAPREDSASSTPTQVDQGELMACNCAHAKAQEGSAQAGEGKGCGCPHCAQAAKASADKGTGCGCSRQGKGSQVQTRNDES